MPWTIRVPMLPDESLSSWLARAALLQGCDPLALTGTVWPGWRAWTVDADRDLSVDRVRSLSVAVGISQEVFARTLLRADAETVAGRALADTETWPWMLALGSRNRKRHGGQQFCPACLAEDAQPYFRRYWRFAWHVACVRHHTPLVDRCDACDAPVTFHRLLAEDGHLALCSRCRSDLRRAGGEPASEATMRFQSTADDALISGAGMIVNRRTATAEWFATARFWVDVIRRASRQRSSRLAAAIRALDIDLPDRAVPVSGLPLELLSVADRQALLDAAYRLMHAGPSACVIALQANNVAAAALTGDAWQVPNPVETITAQLPSGRGGTKRKPRSARAVPHSESAVLGAWARLQRRARVSEP